MIREKIFSLVESGRFKNFIFCVIMFNGLTMGLETYPWIMSRYGEFLLGLDKVIVMIFVVEIVLRIYAHRISFFKDGWSLFDLFIVLVSVVPASEAVSVLRIFRVFRLFRIITVVPQMRKIVTALFSVVPGMISIVALMSVIFYISAVLASWLFGTDFPQWFGDLGKSLYTLFQVMTLESWSMGIVRPVMEVHPYAWLFFIPFIFIATFIIINLIVAVVVDVMNDLGESKESEVELVSKKELQSLRQEIAELKEMLEKKL